ncbi:MAG TPA: hypothetical protein VG457_17745 [Planctomycetota bacterium]|jgi:hypothetical protein|nr:hypothetical protein [Planctomycetota bacterium]
MIPLLIATLFAVGAAGPTFDEAKADPSKRMAHLAAHLDPLVFDKVKNPTGLIKAWYYVADEAQMAAAHDAIKAVFKAEGREFFFAKEVKNIFAPLESPVKRATPWYSDRVSAGAGTKTGILLVGDVFSLANEDEARSVIEDYALALIKLRENGLKVGELELDANIPALKLVSNKSLLPLWAQSGQLEAVMKGARKVSDGFKKELQAQYLATHTLYARQYAQEKKVFDENNENTLQKEIVDFLTECWKTDHARIESLGYKFTLTNKETNEYTLEKK